MDMMVKVTLKPMQGNYRFFVCQVGIEINITQFASLMKLGVGAIDFNCSMSFFVYGSPKNYAISIN